MHERIRETTVKRLLAWLAVLGLLPLSAAAQNVTYIHTDALGSPVLETNAQAQVVRQVDYRAYGMEIMDAPRPGPGYTGHYRDVGTGLVYMQQRYYDPGIGMFLSVDPMASDMNNGWNFNRYNYAANNPYRFTDPDGRTVEIVNDEKRVVADIDVDAKGDFAVNKGELEMTNDSP
jgi:RHS repeat-associated protein